MLWLGIFLSWPEPQVKGRQFRCGFESGFFDLNNFLVFPCRGVPSLVCWTFHFNEIKSIGESLLFSEACIFCLDVFYFHSWYRASAKLVIASVLSRQE